MKSIRFFALMTATCAFLAACVSTGTGSDSKTVIVTPAIKGNTAELQVGDTLELQLPTIPTAGYEWQAQNLDTNILRQEGSAMYTPDTGQNSAGGIVTLKFTAVGTGNTTLLVIYTNSATAGATALSSSSFSVIVGVK
jgi:predicted secreted protein